MSVGCYVKYIKLFNDAKGLYNSFISSDELDDKRAHSNGNNRLTVDPYGGLWFIGGPDWWVPFRWLPGTANSDDNATGYAG